MSGVQFQRGGVFIGGAFIWGFVVSKTCIYLKDNKLCIFSDPNIRVACLTCLGAIVSLPLPLMEVWSVLHPGGRLHSISHSKSASKMEVWSVLHPGGRLHSISHSMGTPGNAGISAMLSYLL